MFSHFSLNMCMSISHEPQSRAMQCIAKKMSYFVHSMRTCEHFRLKKIFNSYWAIQWAVNFRLVFILLRNSLKNLLHISQLLPWSSWHEHWTRSVKCSLVSKCNVSNRHCLSWTFERQCIQLECVSFVLNFIKSKFIIIVWRFNRLH